MGGRSSKIIKKFNGKKKILAISALLKWFSANGRSLPWRTGYERRDIYHVWLSEVMLQQTRVETVIPYYTDFIKRWKNFTSLANANMKEVLKAWQGWVIIEGHIICIAVLLRYLKNSMESYLAEGMTCSNCRELENIPHLRFVP